MIASQYSTLGGMNEGDGQQQGFTYAPSTSVEQKPLEPGPQQSGENPKAAPPESSVRWQASEFVDHDKDSNWFVLLALAAIVLCAATYLISRSIFSTIVVGLAILAFGLTAKQKPRTLQYALLSTGIQAGEKNYKYEDFKSFSVVQEGALWSIVLQPVRRFMPLLTIYFDPNDGEQIFDILATQMPHEERSLDSVDKFLKRIRF